MRLLGVQELLDWDFNRKLYEQQWCNAHFVVFMLNKYCVMYLF